MKRTCVALSVAFSFVAFLYLLIVFLDPGMNVETAFNLLVFAFIGSAALTALVLALRDRQR